MRTDISHLAISSEEYKICASTEKEGVGINQKEVCRILEKAGWRPTGHGKGSHRVYMNPETGQMTTVPYGEIAKGTLAAIRKQTGIDGLK